MMRDCPNKKKVLLTHDGYISTSDDEKNADIPADVSEEHGTDVYPDDVAPHSMKLMVQRVAADRIEGQGQRCNIF